MPPAPYPNRQPTDRLSQTYTMGTNANPVRVTHPFSLFNGPLDGTLDEVRLYDRALSGPEIMTLTQARDYSYDAKGNLTGDRVWGYQYDHENRLTVATNGALRIDYRYDAFGRLIERRTSGASVTTNRLYYAGWQAIAEYDGSGTLQRKYVYGPGIDEPVRMRFTGGVGTNYYYHADGLGSVTEITTNGGFKVESYTYDVYGTPTIYNAAGSVISTPSTGNRLMFTGRDRDPDTTLYNYRYRYYSPSLGRFVQPDPMKLGGGDFNLYRYVGNSPVNRLDSFGTKEEKPKPSTPEDVINLIQELLDKGKSLKEIYDAIKEKLPGGIKDVFSPGGLLGDLTGGSVQGLNAFADSDNCKKMLASAVSTDPCEKAKCSELGQACLDDIFFSLVAAGVPSTSISVLMEHYKKLIPGKVCPK